MPDDLHTTDLRRLLEEMHGGQDAAREELIARALDRVTRLARRMLGDFPSVRRHDQTDDVVQGALMRLLRSLREVTPASTREFYGLAAEQVRRELLDLAKRYGAAKRPRLRDLPDAGNDSTPAFDPAEDNAPAADLDRWQRFHEAVEGLTPIEREVVGLVFYHGWTHAQIAELFQVSDRQVRRYWVSACFHLKERMGGELPAL